MAIAFNNSSNGSATNSVTSLSFSYTCGSGSDRILYVSVIGDTGASDKITGVTYNGVSMTLVQKVAGGNRYTYLFRLVAPATGSNTVTVSASSSTFIGANCSDYTGVDQSSPSDATNTSGPTTATSHSVSVTTVADNCWQVAAYGGFTNTAPTAVSGCTRRGYETIFGTIGLFDSNAAKTPAGAVTFTCQRSGTSHAGILIIESFKPVAAAGLGVPIAAYHYNHHIGSMS